MLSYLAPRLTHHYLITITIITITITYLSWQPSQSFTIYYHNLSNLIPCTIHHYLIANTLLYNPTPLPHFHYPLRATPYLITLTVNVIKSGTLHEQTYTTLFSKGAHSTSFTIFLHKVSLAQNHYFWGQKLSLWFSFWFKYLFPEF